MNKHLAYPKRRFHHEKQSGNELIKILTVLLPFLLIPASAWNPKALFGQEKETPTNARQLLSSMGICPYPEQKELEKILMDKSWMRGKTLSPDDINTGFSNIEDLDWLSPVARDKKVVLFGEWHYYQTIHHLRNRVRFALNTFDYYPLLVVEWQYSISAFMDHYIGINDDREAEDFYQNVIYDLVAEKETYELLEHLRRWNKTRPEKRIHFGAGDVEHDYTSTLKRVILPYFRKLDPAFGIDLDNFGFLDLENLLPELATRLETAKNNNVVGEYPFITPQYIECVIENLRSLFLCYRYDFNYYRQKAIIRNLTDPRYFGRYCLDGKVMIYGGGFHATTHFPYPEGGNFYREGSFLTYDFEPTKGKTFSIEVRGMAYRFGSMTDFDLKNALHHGSGYKSNVQTFQRAYEQKLAAPDKYYYFARELDEWDKLCFAVGYDYDEQPLLVERIDWDSIFKKAKESSKDLYGTVRYNKDYVDRYDLFIIIFRSPIIQVMKKRD